MKNQGHSNRLPSDRVIYYPYKSDYYSSIVVSALRAFDHEVETLPESDKESFYWAKKYNFSKECLPIIIQAGDVIKKVKSPGFDPDKSAFFDFGGNMTPCRNGQEGALIKMLLIDLGYPDIPVYTASYADGKFLTDIKYPKAREYYRLAFTGMAAVDILNRGLHETRPYEINKGEALKTYNEYIARVREAIEKRESLVNLMKEARRAFEKIKVDRREKKITIGLLGETYVRVVESCNDYVLRRLEDLGAEVWVAPLVEWQYTGSMMVRGILLRKKRYYKYLLYLIDEKKQMNEENRILNTFRVFLRKHLDYDINKCIKKYKPYIETNFIGSDVPWFINFNF